MGTKCGAHFWNAFSCIHIISMYRLGIWFPKREPNLVPIFGSKIASKFCFLPKKSVASEIVLRLGCLPEGHWIWYGWSHLDQHWRDSYTISFRRQERLTKTPEQQTRMRPNARQNNIGKGALKMHNDRQHRFGYNFAAVLTSSTVAKCQRTEEKMESGPRKKQSIQMCPNHGRHNRMDNQFMHEILLEDAEENRFRACPRKENCANDGCSCLPSFNSSASCCA